MWIRRFRFDRVDVPGMPICDDLRMLRWCVLSHSNTLGVPSSRTLERFMRSLLCIRIFKRGTSIVCVYRCIVSKFLKLIRLVTFFDAKQATHVCATLAASSSVHASLGRPKTALLGRRLYIAKIKQSVPHPSRFRARAPSQHISQRLLQKRAVDLFASTRSSKRLASAELSARSSKTSTPL